MVEYRVEASVRKDLGKSYRNKLYSRGLIPAVVYGKKLGSLPLEVNEKDLYNVIRSGRNMIISLSVAGNGGPYKVMIRDLQYDPIKRLIKHADFQQISMEENIQSSITVNIFGEPALGLARQLLRKLDISCLPAEIPGFVTVDVNGLNPGDAVKVADLEIPKGIKVNTDADELVVTIVAQDEKNEGSTVVETEGQAMEKEVF